MSIIYLNVNQSVISIDLNLAELTLAELTIAKPTLIEPTLDKPTGCVCEEFASLLQSYVVEMRTLHVHTL